MRPTGILLLSIHVILSAGLLQADGVTTTLVSDVHPLPDFAP